MKGTLATAGAATLAPVLSMRGTAAETLTFPNFGAAQKGWFEKLTVPDTLDLADRARLAINALTGTLDPDHEYEVYQLCVPGGDYPYFTHEGTGFPTINPKYAEALPMMRVMCGSEQNLEHQTGMMKMILSRIQPPGLYFVPPSTETYRPWTVPKFGGSTEWIANTYGNARLMLGCMAWYQYTGDPAWKRVIETLNTGLMKVAVYKDDYAYYPDANGAGGEPFSYPKSGWAHEKEPTRDDNVAGESLFMYTGGQARAMARWAAMSGNEKSLDLSGRICKFMMKPKFWGIEGWGRRHDIPEEKELATVAGAERGLWRGHSAGRIEALRGLIEYAVLTNDSRIKEFVRSAYEWMRNYGVARLGFFPVILGMVAGSECGLPRTIALAIKLTESGIGDYWEDVDQWVRNDFAERQCLPEDFTEEQLARSASAPEIPDGVQLLGPGPGVGGARHVPGCYTTDHVLQRYVGAFGHGCCTSNWSTGLYYAWEAAVRFADQVATVNLLLNRASPWVDVDSYLPYAGKVVIHNKQARKLLVRMPAWVKEREMRCRVNDSEATPFWAGRYVVFEGLRSKDRVTITFPMVTESVTYTFGGTASTYTFKGNTLVETKPKGALGFRPALHQGEAPMKETLRYIGPVIPKW